MTKISIYTDGACSGNPGKGGTGFVILIDGILCHKGGNGYRLTTNNRMEILSVTEALRKTKELLHEQGATERETDVKVTVYSDSQLVVNTYNEGWKKRSNNDLWKALDKELAGFGLTPSFSKVKGHATNSYNNMADELAVGASKNATGIDSAYEDINKREPSLFSAAAYGEPEISEIRFIGENKRSDRRIEVILTNGTIATILPLYEGFQSTGCTRKESGLVVGIAMRYNAWLHGKPFCR